MPPRTTWSHNLTLSGGLALAYVVSMLFSLTLTRAGEGVAVIWFASGILAAAFLSLPWRWSLVLASVCFVLNFACNLVIGNPPLAAFLFPVLTFSEAFGAAWLARRACGATMRLTSFNRVARLILLAVAPATAVTAIVAADLFTLYGRSFDVVLTSWFYGHALGMAIMLPAVLLVCRPDMIGDFRRTVGEQFGLYILIVAVSVATFLPVRFPMALLIFPALALLSFRLGPRGAAVAALIMTVALSSLVVVLPSPLKSAWVVIDRENPQPAVPDRRRLLHEPGHRHGHRRPEAD